MIKKIKDIFKDNWIVLIQFELLLLLLIMFLGISFFSKVFNLTIRLLGYQYLTYDNYLAFICHPITIVCCILIVFIISLFTLMIGTGLILIADVSFQNQKISLKEVISSSFLKISNIFTSKNYPLLGHSLRLFFLINLGLSLTYLLLIVKIGTIKNFIILLILLAFLGIFIMKKFIKYLYILHYSILEQKNYQEAKVASVNLSNSSYTKDILKVGIGQIIMIIVSIILLLISILIIIDIYKQGTREIIISQSLILFLRSYIGIFFIITLLFNMTVNLVLATHLYYKNRLKNTETINHYMVKWNYLASRKKSFMQALVTCFLIVGSLILIYNCLQGKYQLHVYHNLKIEITAHRGESFSYPENTMASFKAAAMLHADWIELDIQQTKDNVLIVMHDTNFKRTTGLNKNIWEVNYNEIKDLDAGGFKGPQYVGEKIPLFEDVLSWAKANNIKLNIELKPTYHEINFEKNVIDLIRKYNYQNDCVVTSQVYQVVENLKQYDPAITTVYVTTFIDNLQNFPAADHYSIAYTGINQKLVNQIHNEGKQIFAWTINSSDIAQQMLELHVDNIIANDTILIRQTINKTLPRNLIGRSIKKIYDFC